MRRTVKLVAMFTLLVVPFQNCSKVDFKPTESSSVASSLAAHTFTSKDTAVETDMNIPVEFVLGLPPATSFDNGIKFVFQPTQPGTVLNGNFEIIDESGFKLKYTPNFGFRGTDSATVNLKDQSGNDVQLNVVVFVGNAIRSLEPALAVRGMGCIQCHAQVASNIVTDFGYKNSYYFGQAPSPSWWNMGSVYGDHANNFNTINIPSDKAVIVPKANLPANIASALKLSTLADYVKSQFSQSSMPTTRAAKVIEKKSIYIGAPADADIISAFKLVPSDRYKYFKNSDGAVELSGLKDQTNFFQNDGVLSCEGDLAIQGPLLLDNLQLNSKTGCRLYVIGSVFIFGNITYTGNDDTRNLEITSTKSISMGLGSALKNGAFCEPTGRYATETSKYGTSSLANRYSTFWSTSGNYVRQSADPVAFGKSILAEAALIEAKVGTLYDASCRVEGRNVSFERILLNAPIVQSRYEGNISGTIIAEFSIMSLGMFKFSFDPVLSKVPIFPFLDPKLYLDVQD